MVFMFHKSMCCFIVSLPKTKNKKKHLFYLNIALLFFLYLFAGSQFVASIEIDADFTDADYDLQSQRMTDLEEEVHSFLLHF